MVVDYIEAPGRVPNGSCCWLKRITSLLGAKHWASFQNGQLPGADSSVPTHTQLAKAVPWSHAVFPALR
jgi:hypothetical protein